MSNDNNNRITCNNCGKDGHMFYQCKLPVISCGIILFRRNKESGIIEYLMNRRRNSYGYVDMIRGKYNVYDINQMASLVQQMSATEKESLLTKTFDELWNGMWGGMSATMAQNEYLASSKKFNHIKSGVTVDNTLFKIEDIVNNCNTEWNETEWEFPKGRRSTIKERDLECALREVCEETGITPDNIDIIENLITFEETFIGTNYKCYKHKYFLGTLKNPDISLSNFQHSEVSKLEWKSLDECLQIIRPDNLEKKGLITNINNVLQQFRLYS
jgi:ADP-ribose pyrophosphatase YjhB (NUDIX family)